MIHITSHMMKTIWTPILFFIITITAFLATLLYGIHINNLELPGLNANGLYIKLDKKLIVEAKNIVIHKTSNKETSKEEILSIIDKLPWLDRLFSIIDIKKISFDNNEIKILYKNDVFYIDSTHLILDASIFPTKKGLHVKVKELLVKDVDANLQGVLDIDIRNNKILFYGDFGILNINGKASIKLQNNILTYSLKTSNFSSLAPLMKYLESKLEIEKEVGLWTYKKITAKDFELKKLKGKVNIKTGEFFPKQMYGKAHVKEAKVQFHPNVAPANINAMDVILKDNKLIFNIHKASYLGLDVSQSHAYIYNLLTTGNGIVLILKANARLDEKIHPILKAYDVNIPVIQTSGKTKAVVELDIKFLPYDLDVKGFFIVENSNILLSNAPMHSKYAQINLNNHIISLSNTNLSYDGLFDLDANAKINTKEGTLNGDVHVKNLNVGFGKNPIITVKNIKLPTQMNFTKEKLEIMLPSLQTSLLFADEYNEITQNNLSLLYDYSKLMQDNSIKDGKISIQTKDFKNFDINLFITKITTPLLKNGKIVNNLKLDIQANKDNIQAYTVDNALSLQVDSNKTFIKLKNYDIVVKNDSNETNESSNSTLHVELKNGNMILSDYNRTILSKNMIIERKNKNLKLFSSYADGKLNLESTSSMLKINVENQTDNFINTFLNKNTFDGGTFNLNLYGNNFQNFAGAFKIKESYLKNMKIYNDLLSLINTLPALATFKSPDFNEKGYRIKKANIIFSRKENIITFHEINIDGTTADIEGKGNLNLENENIFLELNLSTLKDVSKIVDKIPGINYILLGEKGDITTSIKVIGTLEKPEVKTQVIKDTLSTPVNIIKRTLELPFKLFTK